MKEGWICPICGRVLAPWVPECQCRGVTNTQTSNYTFVRDTAANPNYAQSWDGQLPKITNGGTTIIDAAEIMGGEKKSGS
jgi:hypothetical protein